MIDLAIAIVLWELIDIYIYYVCLYVGSYVCVCMCVVCVYVNAIHFHYRSSLLLRLLQFPLFFLLIKSLRQWICVDPNISNRFEIFRFPFHICFFTLFSFITLLLWQFLFRCYSSINIIESETSCYIDPNATRSAIGRTIFLKIGILLTLTNTSGFLWPSFLLASIAPLQSPLTLKKDFFSFGAYTSAVMRFRRPP